MNAKGYNRKIKNVTAKCVFMRLVQTRHEQECEERGKSGKSYFLE